LVSPAERIYKFKQLERAKKPLHANFICFYRARFVSRSFSVAILAQKAAIAQLFTALFLSSQPSQIKEMRVKMNCSEVFFKLADLKMPSERVVVKLTLHLADKEVRIQNIYM
jgi:hypothetical protein